MGARKKEEEELMLYLLLISLSAAQTPDWVEGVRSGEESLKVVQGTRVFYRRVLKDADDCEKTKQTVLSDIRQDTGLGSDAPSTLDYAHYDSKREECAVTISIANSSVQQQGLIEELKAKNEEMKKKFDELATYLHQNRDLLNKEEKRHRLAQDEAVSLDRETQRVERYLRLGMSSIQLRKLIGKKPDISHGYSTACYDHFKSYYQSYHGDIYICWNKMRQDSYAVGYCRLSNNKCYLPR